MTPVVVDAGGAALSAQDLKDFEEQGFLIVRQALAPAHVATLRRAIAAARGIDLDRPDTWYERVPERNGSVYLYHDQSQWDARQSPRVHRAFADLLPSSHLWVSIDRAKLQMPIRDDDHAAGIESFIHWDIDLRSLPRQLMLQGVVCLSPSSARHGGFHCVPGFHRELLRLAGRKDWNPRAAAARFGAGDVHVVDANEGDLVVWNSLLPHGAGRNHSAEPRVAQFVRMFPAAEEQADVVCRRLRIWRDRLPPGGAPTLDVPGPPARLTALGRRLLGVDRWDLQPSQPPAAADPTGGMLQRRCASAATGRMPACHAGPVESACCRSSMTCGAPTGGRTAPPNPTGVTPCPTSMVS